MGGLARPCNHAHLKGGGGGEPLRRSRHYRETSNTTPIIPIGGRMQIVETQELVPSCHRPEIVEPSELQPTCHSYPERRHVGRGPSELRARATLCGLPTHPGVRRLGGRRPGPRRGGC